MNALEVMTDAELFGDVFGRPSWEAWRVVLAAVFGLPPPTTEALELYRRCTGRTQWPEAAAREAWVVAGRRAGKSRAAALVAVFLGAFTDAYRAALAPGERGVVMVVAADRRQARVVLGYIKALLRHRLLQGLVERETAEAVELSTGVALEVHTASYRTIRGYSVVAAVLDEVAFWRSEDAAEPDVEILNALRPAMTTVPGSLLLGISSPYARRGVLWRAHSRHFGQDGDPVLCWRAPSRVMNPTISARVVEEARSEDPAAAAAEWEAEFRSDLETFVDREAVERCVVPGRHELPPRNGVTYCCFVDPSGGKADSFTLAIGHREGDFAIVDALRERRPPFNPDAVVEEFASLARAYRVQKVVGDRYAGAWVSERFAARRLRYEPSSVSKSDLYVSLLPTVNAGRVELPEERALVHQLAGLERRVRRGGRDSIDHPPGGQDDLANAVAGLTHLLVGRRPKRVESFDPFAERWWWPENWPRGWEGTRR